MLLKLDHTRVKFITLRDMSKLIMNNATIMIKMTGNQDSSKVKMKEWCKDKKEVSMVAEKVDKLVVEVIIL